MSEDNNNTSEVGNGAFTASLLANLDLSVPEIEKVIAEASPPFSRAQLSFLLGAENAGKTRKTAVTVLQNAIDALDAADKAAAEAAARAAAEEADAKRAAFGRGVALAEGADPVAAARTGGTFLVLGDGQREIAGLSRIDAKPDHFSVAGGRVMYGRPIRISGADAKVMLHNVALLDEEGVVHAVCEIPGGLQLGGRDVELPAGSLIFG